jgi:hypothetical protein
LSPNYFTSLIKDEMLFVRTIKMDTVSMYVLGVFYNKSDAQKYLIYLKENGLNQAYIVNQYELEKESKSNNDDNTKLSVSETNIPVYTVQVKATKNPLNISSVFTGIEGIREIKADDGFYKYFYGEFKTLSKAKEALLFIKKSGYEDAFIRQIKV